MSLYGKPEYWQDRYSRNSNPFDWYQRLYAFKQHLLPLISVKQNSKILIPGCGNSRLAEEMVEQGYANITNIDSSVTCIKNMSEKYKLKTEKIKFQCMDVRQMSYANQSFDGIVDKALLDCIMCGQKASQNCYKMLCQIYRVLKKKGVYILLSYESASKRLFLLEKSQFEWKVNVIRIPKPSSKAASYSILQEGQQATYHYLYICTKQ